MSWLSSLMNPGEGYKKGQEQLDKYYGQAQGALSPYNQYGQEQYGNLNDIIKNLMNPSDLNAKWIAGYSESPEAKQAEQMASQHGLNAASSMGLMGSNSALNALQQGTSQIGLNDRQNYLKNMMDQYLGAANLSQGVFGQGANAANNMSNNAMNMGQNSAGMAYGQQTAGGNMLGGMLGTAAGVAGTALGGPIGGALGAGLSQKMGWSPTGSYNPGVK